MKRLFILFAAILMVVGCESQLATYEDLAGDGKIRYVGKVNGLTVATGWERFELEWDANVDPTVERYLLTWSSEGLVDSVYFDASWRSFNTGSSFEELGLPKLDFNNDSYIFRIYAVDGDGRVSREEMAVASTINANHQSVKFLPVAQDKVIFADNSDGSKRAVVILKPRDLKEREANLEYTNPQGEVVTREITEDDYDNGYLSVDVSADSKEIMFNRAIELEECIDLVQVAQGEPVVDYEMDAGFKTAIQQISGYNPYNGLDDYIDSVQVVNFDYSLTTIADLVTFPELKRVVLGGNRFLASNMPVSELTTEEKSHFDNSRIDIRVLKYLKSVNPDFKVKIYSDMFSVGSELSKVEDLVEGGYMDKPQFPTGITFFDTGYSADQDNQSVDLSANALDYTQDLYGWPAPINHSHSAYLFDYFSDLTSQNYRRAHVVENPYSDQSAFRIINTAGARLQLKGFAIRNIGYDYAKTEDIAFIPTTITDISVSVDSPFGGQELSYLFSNQQMGNSRGEITIFYFKEPVSCYNLELIFPLNGKMIIDDIMLF